MENPFLKTFGRPARELACECEPLRATRISRVCPAVDRRGDGQWQAPGRWRSDGSTCQERVARAGQHRALRRRPLPGSESSELAAAVKHLTSSKDRRQAIEDLGWALINSKEFLFRQGENARVDLGDSIDRKGSKSERFRL